MSQALFPGLRPDAAGRERFGKLAGALLAACPPDAPRPQLRRPDQWHATLCFIGYDLQHLVTPKLLGAFADAAARIPAHAFAIERIAYWRQSGAIVALPHACDALQALCDATRDATRRCNIRPQQVTTQPHVTLAYLERGLDAQDWLEGVDCSGDLLQVEQFELLFNPGGRYQALASWPLTGSSLPVAPHQPSLI